MTAERCVVCNNALYVPDGPPARRRHCTNPACDWCVSCFAAKRKECDAEPKAKP